MLKNINNYKRVYLLYILTSNNNYIYFLINYYYNGDV